MNTAFLQYFEILNTGFRDTNIDVRHIFISWASQFKSANVDLCLTLSVLWIIIDLSARFLFKTPGPQDLDSQFWLKYNTGSKNEYARIFGIFTITVELV